MAAFTNVKLAGKTFFLPSTTTKVPTDIPYAEATVDGTLNFTNEDGDVLLQKNGVNVYGVTHVNTGNTSERYTSLDVYNETQRTVFSQQLSGLKAGEILIVLTECQVTNDLGYNVGVTAYLILGDTSLATTGTEISEANGFNVTPNMHHGKIVKVGTLEVTDADITAGRDRVNLVVWAYSTASSPGDTISIDQDYGRLSVIRLR